MCTCGIWEWAKFLQQYLDFMVLLRRKTTSMEKTHVHAPLCLYACVLHTCMHTGSSVSRVCVSLSYTIHRFACERVCVVSCSLFICFNERYRVRLKSHTCMRTGSTNHGTRRRSLLDVLSSSEWQRAPKSECAKIGLCKCV